MGAEANLVRWAASRVRGLRRSCRCGPRPKARTTAAPGSSTQGASATDLKNQLDGAELGRNARRVEEVLVDAGLAVSLSDRTTIVGERARR